MIYIPGRIPISIHPLFWLTAVIIGFLNSGTLIGTLVWMGVIFVSVLVHELGHASTALFFGLKPSIALVALGGLTTHKGDSLPLWKQFLIVFNGPLFGFVLFLAAWFLLKFPSTGIVHVVLALFFWVNLVWTILNLVPVMPLDGGQLLRILLEGCFGSKGFKYSLIVGMVFAVAICAVCFFFQNFLIGALFFLFAFQSLDLYRRTRLLSNEDRIDHLKKAFEVAEADLRIGNKEKALEALEHIREQTQEGMIHLLATEYVAFLKYEQKDSETAYKLLLPLRAELSNDGLSLLHRAAFEQKDYKIVDEIGGKCFQLMPVKEVALKNAFACGVLAKEKSAVGWLEAAFQEGLENIATILKEPYFDPIRETAHFKQFQKIHL